MGGTLKPHNPGLFAVTKVKLLVLVSLAITWWFAHLLPHYEPVIKSAVSTRLGEARKNIPSIYVDWHRDKDPRANYDTSKVALLVEPRYLPHIVPLILHMIYVVPPDWRFVFIGSDKSVKAIGRSFAIQHQQVVGKLDLMKLPVPWDIGSKEMIYRLMTDLRFYDEFLPGVEWILKYESDSILCANSDKSLNDWLDWSWAGAPRSLDDRFAGNGGLSLRKVSAIRKVLKFQQRFNDSHAEDEWFGQRLWVLPGEKVASGTNGALAVEDVYIEKPMGYHIRDGGKSLPVGLWADMAQRKKIFEYCPELSMIMDMKLERERCPNDNGDGTIDRASIEAARKIAEEEEVKRKSAEEAERKSAEEAERKSAEEAERNSTEEEARKTAEEVRKSEHESLANAHVDTEPTAFIQDEPEHQEQPIDPIEAAED